MLSLIVIWACGMQWKKHPFSLESLCIPIHTLKPFLCEVCGSVMKFIFWFLFRRWKQFCAFWKITTWSFSLVLQNINFTEKNGLPCIFYWDISASYSFKYILLSWRKRVLPQITDFLWLLTEPADRQLTVKQLMKEDFAILFFRVCA